MSLSKRVITSDTLITTDECLLELGLDTALQLPGAELHQFAPEWDAVRVSGKWFLNTTIRDHRIINVKANPFDVLRFCEEFSSITPGYHMNKKHWISLNPGSDMTVGLVQTLVSDSYFLVAASLPRSKRPVASNE